MATQKDKWERMEKEMIKKYLPKLKALCKKEDLILDFVPIEFNIRNNMNRKAGTWDGHKITLYKSHFAGLTKETLVHELLHAFISQNNLQEQNKKSELFNKLVLNLNTKKFKIGSCHGAYLWKYKCKCGYGLRTNDRYKFGWSCCNCGTIIRKATRNMTKEINF